MKTTLAILLATGCAASCFGQGLVYFSNHSAFVTTADRLVRAPGGMPLANTDFVAQLYFGPDASSLQPVAAVPSHFMPISTSSPGLWFGGIRTLSGFPAGSTATLQVRVWNISLYPTFEQAVTAGGVYGQSLPFLYTVPAAPLPPPQAFYMDNFRGFQLVPEPSSVALLLIGAAAFFLAAGSRSPRSGSVLIKAYLGTNTLQVLPGISTSARGGATLGA
jgi:hypothetical protein